MPFNGSGGTSQPVGGAFPASANTLIESNKVNISIADIYAMLASCLVKDGQQVATQRIPFASGIQTDTVTEKTSDTGVTLDSVLLKDGRIDTTQGADIVCAATINLETATGNVVDVTGSTGPVTAITLSQGHWRLVRFTSTPTLTHGASLVLPGAANITVAAGDYALFVGYASSVVRCASYVRAASMPATLSGTETLTNKSFGMGTGAGTATPVGVAHVNTTAVGNIGGGTDDLMTYSLPANSLSANGKGVRVTAWGTTANNANAKTLTAAFGGTSSGTSMTTSIAGAWHATFRVFRTGSNTQDFSYRLSEVENNAVLAAPKEKQLANTTPSETDSGAITVKFTAAGTADNDIVQEGMIVEFLN